MVKTNAVRSLNRLGIDYELREYDVDPDDLSAETVAANIGLPPEQVFKTLAVKGDRNGICLAVISADQELDFKALAKQTGDRKIDMVPLKEVAGLDWLHSRRSNRSGVQERLSGVYRRARGNLRRDVGVRRHTRAADHAGSS